MTRHFEVNNPNKIPPDQTCHQLKENRSTAHIDFGFALLSIEEIITQPHQHHFDNVSSGTQQRLSFA